MENKKMVKQMIDLHKTSFDNNFSTMISLQKEAGKFIMVLVDLTPGMSDESNKVIDQWIDTYKKVIDDVKKAINEGYGKVEEFFNSNAMVMLQDQTEKVFNTFLNQKNWMPQDLKKTMEQLTDIYKKGCDDFKKHLDENIKRMGNFSSVVNKPQTDTKKEK